MAARTRKMCLAYPEKRVLKDPDGQDGVHAHSGRDIARPGFVMRCRETVITIPPRKET